MTTAVDPSTDEHVTGPVVTGPVVTGQPVAGQAVTADRIVLRGLTAHGRHGVLATERETGQSFGLDLELEVDTRPAAASDDLADTVDYSAVAAAALGVVTGEPVDLVETLADRVARTVLADPRVRAVTVSVHKPQAPLEVPFDDVVVVIRRTRPAQPTPLQQSSPPATGDDPTTGGHDA